MQRGENSKKRGRVKCTPSSAAAATCLYERTRYQKQASTVRNMRAVLKKASWGTRRIFGSIRCKKQASTVRKGYSVPKTAFSGTRRIFKGPQNSRLHRLWTASCRTGRSFSARNGPRSEVSRHKKRVTSKSIKTFWSFPQRPYCCRRMRILRRRRLLQKKIKKEDVFLGKVLEYTPFFSSQQQFTNLCFSRNLPLENLLEVISLRI